MSSVRTKNPIESDPIYDKYPLLTSVPQSLKLDPLATLNKPIFIKTFNWSTTAVYTNIITIDMPITFAINSQVKAMFNIAAMYRTKVCLILQVAGTPLHMGTLLVSAFPPSTFDPTTIGKKHVNSFLQAPHVFLSANESTAVCLEVPFYSTTKLKSTDMSSSAYPYGNGMGFATIYGMIFNQLAVSSGSTSISISAHIMLIEPEFYVPVNRFEAQSSIVSVALDSVSKTAKSLTADFIDRMRSTVTQYTGLHNPNSTVIDNRVIHTNRNFSNLVDIPTQFEKLDPFAQHDRIVDEPVFYTDKDEMLLSNILSKPQYLDSFSVTTSTSVGTLLWSRPITPFQEKLSEVNLSISTPLAVFSTQSRYWRGTIKLHIQSVMTNFHYTKLLVVKDYSRNSLGLSATLSLNDSVGLLTDTLEFSAGGQVHTVDLPYCSEFEELMCSPVPEQNALSHGIYRIYALLPLVTNASAPSSVRFNVFISAGSDFNFFGYGVEPLYPIPFVAQAAEFVSSSSQEGIVNVLSDHQPVFARKFRPIVSVRDYIRRFQRTCINKVSPERLVAVVPITDILGYHASSTTYFATSKIMRSYFYGATGGLKFKAKFFNASDVVVQYIPPGQTQADDVSQRSVFALPSVTAVNSYLKDMNKVYEGTTDTYLPHDPFNFPHIEFVQTSCPTGSTFNGDNFTLSKNIVELEFAIPQMNNNEFIADKYLNNDHNTVATSTDYGTLLFSFLSKYPNGQVENDLPAYQISFAYTDEARFGFNVFAPVLSFENASGTVVEYWGPFQSINNVVTDLSAVTRAPSAFIGGT